MLFGHGLVGQAVSAAIESQTSARGVYVAYNWEDNTQRSQTRRELFKNIDSSVPLRIVWTAGRAGFGSTTEEMAVETALIQEVLDWVGDFAEDHQDISFQFISSAGGLFEGEIDVTAATTPAPQRPYGLAKLQQEKAVADAANAGNFAHRTYRLSSVYGFAPKSRVGLISALVMNGLTGQTTQITGDVGTLRDYVFAQDIGDIILRQLNDLPNEPEAPLLLASGVSASIEQVISLIEPLLPQPMKIEYQAVPTNNADMSFAPNALPSDWSPTTLEDGIKDVVTQYRHMLSNA